MKKIQSILLSISSILTFSCAEVLEIYPQISGEITSQAKHGQTFKKGDILVSFDDRQIQTKLAQHEGIVSLKKTLLDDAQKILNENTTLYQSTVAAKRDVEVAQLEFDKAKAIYQTEVATLEYLKLEKEKYTIKAPFDGIVKNVPNRLNATNINQPKILLLVESR